MHLIAPVLAVLAASPVVADDLGPRQNPLPIQTGEPDVLHVVHRRSRQTQDGSLAGQCDPVVSAHTDASFTGGQYLLQGGFAQSESAAVSWVLPANAFPIRLDLAEMIFGTQAATTATTTEWGITVYEGLPSTGTPVASTPRGRTTPPPPMPVRRPTTTSRGPSTGPTPPSATTS